MNTVLEIERAISALSSNELDELYTWMDQNCPIDVRLKTDLAEGRIDDRIARALADQGPETLSLFDARDGSPCERRF